MKMQHQFWVTKQTVLKKLGSKEDECIVTSDAELDAKLELFRSISDSCTLLQRVIDQYQERSCVLAQEESALGRYLRDAGKNGDGAGKLTAVAGKAFCYAGQQRHSSRNSLLRLHHEVETFRGRAVTDARATISAMEKARTEYRAALSWMKATSAQLDPDTGHGLHKFRKAQAQVRESKRTFDKLKLDCLQKVDLLAAARCNMFSHGLVNYQSTFLNFVGKVTKILQSTSKLLSSTPQYEFSVLKELTQASQTSEFEENETLKNYEQNDQLLYFKDEYKDESDTVDDDKKKDMKMSCVKENVMESVKLVDTMENLIDVPCSSPLKPPDSCVELAGLNFNNENTFEFLSPVMPSQLLQDSMFSNSWQSNTKTNASLPTLPFMSTSNTPSKVNLSSNSNAIPAKKQDIERKDMTAWYQLFAELDPIANPNSLMSTNTSTQSEA